MPEAATKPRLALIAVIFIICGVAIILLNVINYLQDGRFGTLSVFAFLIILLGLWFLSYGRKSTAGD